MPSDYTQLQTRFPPPKPLESRAEIWWLAFTLDTNDDAAQARFVERYGHEPRVFVRDGAILKVGPIEEGR